MLLCANTEIHDYLRETVQIAHRLGKEHNLLQCLYRLGHEFYQHEYVCFLYKDMAKYSFGFECFYLKDVTISDDNSGYMMRKPGAQPWCIGGLIYHGPDIDGIEHETFNVRLVKSDGWSINT